MMQLDYGYLLERGTLNYNTKMKVTVESRVFRIIIILQLHDDNK